MHRCTVLGLLASLVCTTDACAARAQLCVWKQLSLPPEFVGLRGDVVKFMGLLPEIHRAWVSVDDRLYFYNYVTHRVDAHASIKLERLVLSIGLAPAKPGVFKDHIRVRGVAAELRLASLLTASRSAFWSSPPRWRCS